MSVSTAPASPSPATQGASDGFTCASDPDLPTTVRSQIAIVLHDDLMTDAEWANLVRFASSKLKLPTVIEQDGQTFVTVLAARSGEYGNASSGPLIPWTPFTNKTAGLFARRLANTSRPRTNSNDDFALANALTTAGHQIAGNGVGGGYRSILMMSETPDLNPSGLQAVRDDIIFTQGQADQINLLAVADGPDAMQPAPVDRLYGLSNAVESAFQVPNLTGTHPLEDNLGFSAALDAADMTGAYASYFDPNLGPVLERMFQRMSFCPGDYNRNGMLDGNDPDDFEAASQAGVDPYADWNFDGNWDGHVPGEIDFEKFEVSFNVVPITIPCP